MTTICSQPIYPVYLDGMIEIIGAGGTADVLKAAGLDEWMSTGRPAAPRNALNDERFASLQRALVEVYGERSGEGLALRIGRAACRTLLRRFGEELGLTTLDQRLLPTPARLRAGLQKLAQAVADGQTVTVTETPDAYLWRVKGCVDCAGRAAETHAACAFTTGFLQEFMEITGGGKTYRVTETECAACGQPACLFTLTKKPLD